jgi:hypothetical protein
MTNNKLDLRKGTCYLFKIVGWVELLETGSMSENMHLVFLAYFEQRPNDGEGIQWVTVEARVQLEAYEALPKVSP